MSKRVSQPATAQQWNSKELFPPVFDLNSGPSPKEADKSINGSQGEINDGHAQGSIACKSSWARNGWHKKVKSWKCNSIGHVRQKCSIRLNEGSSS